ncbi:MAG: thioredoxin domain-containing protein [Acidobacteria bacterium]|nr:thioredoxin domain-containing protein [Acidobacteriota bacterium]
MVGVPAIAALTLGVFAFLPRAQVAPVDLERVSDDRTLGPKSASVTIVEYGDFGCPACKAWHDAGVLDELRAQYGDLQEAMQRGFRGTPAFLVLVNGQPITLSGPPTVEYFQRVIDPLVTSGG